MGNTNSNNSEGSAKLFETKTNIGIENTFIVDKLYHKSYEQITVDQQTFDNQFKDKTKMLNSDVSLLDNFDWSNVIIAGGFILSCLEKLELQGKYKKSDIDFWVYGSDRSDLEEKMKKVILFFSSKLPGVEFDIYMDTFVVTMKSSLFARPIQVIGIVAQSKMEVLESFDFTHCQVGYDGSDLFYTDGFLKSMITRQTKTNKKMIKAIRMSKALERGFMIDRSDDFHIPLKICAFRIHKYHVSDVPSQRLYSDSNSKNNYFDESGIDKIRPQSDKPNDVNNQIPTNQKFKTCDELFEYMKNITPKFITKNDD
jgi:hypothetical protein